MRKDINIRKAIISSVFGAVILTGAAIGISAQNVDSQLRQWQRAQMEAQREYNDYLRTRSPREYQQWQRAQARAQREQNDYQRAVNMANSRGRWNDRNTSWAGTGYNNTNMQYRVYRDGNYYYTDNRGAELLRNAVRSGYSQGYRQGQIDRRYGRGGNYGAVSMYQSGTYGYQSYVDRNQYQYYFQQGFQRGYQDGYQNTYQYGSRSGNGFNILAGVLNTILNITNNR